MTDNSLDTDRRYHVKVVLLGSAFSGKTCLVTRLMDGIFTGNETASVGCAFMAKSFHIGDVDICLGIWDTCGQERYESLMRIYYQNAAAAIICYAILLRRWLAASSRSYENGAGSDVAMTIPSVGLLKRNKLKSMPEPAFVESSANIYDLTSKTSYEKTSFWINELKENTKEACEIYLVGTKLDLVDDNHNESNLRAVDSEEVEKFAKEVGASIFETSSKTGHNIDELFKSVAEDYFKFGLNRIKARPKSIKLHEKQPVETNGSPTKSRCSCAKGGDSSTVNSS